MASFPDRISCMSLVFLPDFEEGRQGPHRGGLASDRAGCHCRVLGTCLQWLLGGGPMQRLIVGISGASGIIYGIRLLEALRGAAAETHLVMSEAAKMVTEIETGYSVAQVEALADAVYQNSEIEAPISSGSFQTLGMVVAPCA